MDEKMWTVEDEWRATGQVTCADCGSRVRTRTLETLPEHRCTEMRARRKAEREN